jgi:hypothetical protein
VGGECVGGRCSVVTDWGRIGRGGKDRGREWLRRSERVARRDSNGL